jgi:hypothetical protein
VQHDDVKQAPKDQDRRDVICGPLDRLIKHLRESKD